MAKSTFPDGIDSFPTHYEPPASAMAQIARYETLRAKISKTPSEQEEFEDLTEALAPYMFTTEELNTMQEAMVNLETYFKDKTVDQLASWNTEITEKLNNAQSKIEEDINNAKINVDEMVSDRVDKFQYKGVYAAATTYYKENIVRYENSLYQCTAESATGVVPTDTASWELMMPNQKGDKGVKGDPGLSLIFHGQWTANTEYVVDEMVTYGNKLFACTTAHTSGDAFDSTKWLSVIDSNNIDLEATALKMNCYYTSSLKEESSDKMVITEQVITGQPSDSADTKTVVLSCVTTITADTSDINDDGEPDFITITAVYTDTLDLLGFGGTFNWNATLYSDGSYVAKKPDEL